MKKQLIALCLLSGSAAHASIIDFADSQFATTFGSASALYTDTVTFDGVDFEVTADAFGGNGFRLNTIFGGQNFGKAGNGLISLSFTSTQDVVFTSIVGSDRSDLPPVTTNPDLPFDLLVDAVPVVTDFTFTAAGEIWDFADITLSAGSSLTIAADVSDVTSAAVLGALSFARPIPTSDMPAPATLALLGLGIVALGYRRRKAVTPAEPT